MFKSLKFTRTAGFAVGLMLASALVVAAQRPDPNKPAEQIYKNIQVLNGVPSTQVVPMMQFMRDSLGVTCEYCHVDDRTKREADDKPAKKTGRMMIGMELAINKENFKGAAEVTCFTCHRGSINPVGSPVIPSEHPVLLDKEEKPDLPAADGLLSKYIAALGGEDAIRKVNTRVITYTRDQSAAPGAAAPPQAMVERDMKAPNMVVNIAKSPAGNTSDGFDGNAAWALDAKGKVSDVNGPSLDAAKRGADFYGDLGLDLNLKQRYTRFVTRRIEKIEAREAYVVFADKKEGDVAPDRLYFDIETGLLLRLIEFNPTSLGNDPTYTDYHDYRNVGGGLKYPFQIDRYGMAAFAMMQVQKVQDNVAVDSGKFSKPAGQ